MPEDKTQIDRNDWFRNLGHRDREPADPNDANAWFKTINKHGGLVKKPEDESTETEDQQ